MDRDSIAAGLFGLVGAGFLARFALSPGLEAPAILTAVLSVGFLALAITTVRSDETLTQTPDTPRVLAAMTAAILAGVAVYWGI